MAQNVDKTQIVGNYNLVSSTESEVAEFLRKRNLAKVNAASAKVMPADNIYSKYIKRVLDIIISGVALIVTLPINLVLAICTFFDVGRPIFYKQNRVGRDGKYFTLIKLRNMNEKKDENGNLLPASQRVTKFGRIMRKYSIDELLNFWSVLKGDMSIIGPRPIPIFFCDRMSERHKMRHAVRPGLECPRVIELGEGDYSQYHKQFENDVWYVENISFKTDVKLIFHLVKMTLFSMKERKRNSGAASYFVGYDDTGCATSLTKFHKDYNEVDLKNN